MSKIDELVKTYNEIEEQQRARLVEILRLLRVRKGYREVRFTNGNDWTNIHANVPEELALPVYVDSHCGKIKTLIAGEE